VPNNGRKIVAKFMVLYRSSVPANEQMAGTTPEQAQAGMEAWMQWAGKAGDAIVDLGSPLSPAATIGGGSDGQPIAGFSILQGDSRDAVAKLLEDHPHFHSPGEPSIQLLEFLPIPGT
jgi:hypothetical protein